MSKLLMNAVICPSYGPPEVLQLTKVPRPVHKDNEVLIRIHATAVNSGDVRVRGLAVSGIMRLMMLFALGFSKPRKPILGTVLSGVVEEVGSAVTLYKKGDEVFAMTGFKFGTYAEYIAVKENSPLTFKPQKASHEEAAAIIFGGSTAIHFLQKAKIGVKPDQQVLIYGATGSVGTSAIQVAKHYGAHVTAVCSQSGISLAKSLGADEVIDYTHEDFTKAGKQYDIIFDAVGKINKQMCSSCLATDGVFLTVGGWEVAGETKEQLLLLKELFDSNRLRAAIDKTYPLKNIVEAHSYVDRGHKKGNVVITIYPG